MRPGQQWPRKLLDSLWARARGAVAPSMRPGQQWPRKRFQNLGAGDCWHTPPSMRPGQQWPRKPQSIMWAITQGQTTFNEAGATMAPETYFNPETLIMFHDPSMRPGQQWPRKQRRIALTISIDSTFNEAGATMAPETSRALALDRF